MRNNLINESSLPDQFVERLRAILPIASFTSCIATFSGVKAVTFRVNTLKINVSDLRQLLSAMGIQIQAIPWMDTAFILMHDDKSVLTQNPNLDTGFVYVQNLSSMLSPLILAPRPDTQVLDLAAAPGGKTLLMACMMNNTGSIAAVEKVKARFFKLLSNIKQHDARCIRTFLKDGCRVGKVCPERFDSVLLDAPCSSEARMHTSRPESMVFWSEKKIKEMARKQKRLLISAVQSLQPGGRLLYCTCSYAPEENERVIASALKRFGDALTLEPIAMPFTHWQPGLTHWRGDDFDQQLQKTVRVLPSLEMDGCFLGLLKKNKSIL